jgi:hypothetical protein
LGFLHIRNSKHLSIRNILRNITKNVIFGLKKAKIVKKISADSATEAANLAEKKFLNHAFCIFVIPEQKTEQQPSISIRSENSNSVVKTARLIICQHI